MKPLAIIGATFLAVDALAALVLVLHIRNPSLNADTCAHLSVREAGMPEECWG